MEMRRGKVTEGFDAYWEGVMVQAEIAKKKLGLDKIPDSRTDEEIRAAKAAERAEALAMWPRVPTYEEAVAEVKRKLNINLPDYVPSDAEILTDEFTKETVDKFWK